MTSQLDIANRALLAVGARQQVSSINPSDGSVEANAISVLWQPTFEQLARTAPWNCLTKQLVLSLVAAASGTPENPEGQGPLPLFPWAYAYAYPADCLDFRFVIPSFPSGTGGLTPQTTYNNQAGIWFPDQGQIPYVVSSMQDVNNNTILVILTNQSMAQGVYTQNNSNPAIWDSLFQGAMVASLAVFLVPALSLSMQLMQLNIGVADKMITLARARDGNEGVTVMDHVPDWILARAGETGYGYGWGLWNGTTGLSMAWPIVE